MHLPMKGRKGILSILLALGLLVAAQALASPTPNLPTEVVEALKGGATVALLDAEGNLIWSSDLGKPEEAPLSAAASVAIYDAEGNLIATYPLTPLGDQVFVELPDGTKAPAKPLVKLAHQANRDHHAGKTERHQEQKPHQDEEKAHSRNEHRQGKPSYNHGEEAERHAEKPASHDEEQKGHQAPKTKHESKQKPHPHGKKKHGRPQD